MKRRVVQHHHRQPRRITPQRYEDIEDHSPEHFHRATGVSKTLFSEMLSTLEAAKPRMGRPPKLSLANQVVVCLMYLREYRTQFHIAHTMLS